MQVTRINIITGKPNTMELPISVEQLIRWESGELVQIVFPELTPFQREFLITGMTREEQDELFNNFEE